MRKAIPKKGFTLIEILIVLGIMAVILSLVTLSVSLFSASGLGLDRFSNHLYAQLLVVQEKSLMTQQAFRLEKETNIYGFKQFDTAKAEWVWLLSPKRLQRDKIQNGIDMQITDESSRPIQTITFYPTGEFSPFVIRIQSKNEKARVIKGTKEGQIELNRMEGA